MISLIMTFFVFNQSSSATFRDFTLHDRILPNRNFESFPTSDWLQCIEACHTAPRCISYNFDAKSTNSCILNNCGFRDRCEALRNVVVSSGAIFHQLKEAKNDTLCNLPIVAVTEHLSLNKTGSGNTSYISGPPRSGPAKCPYGKDVSQEESLLNATVCGRWNILRLNACSNKNPIRLINVRYLQCTCRCEACKEVHVPDACVPRDVFTKISKACEGKAWCLVRLRDAPCDIQHKMAISVRYRCYTGDQNQNRFGNEDHENRRRHGH